MRPVDVAGLPAASSPSWTFCSPGQHLLQPHPASITSPIRPSALAHVLWAILNSLPKAYTLSRLTPPSISSSKRPQPSSRWSSFLPFPKLPWHCVYSSIITFIIISIKQYLAIKQPLLLDCASDQGWGHAFSRYYSLRISRPGLCIWVQSACMTMKFIFYWLHQEL